jgi:hypothetical protein
VIRKPGGLKADVPQLRRYPSVKARSMQANFVLDALEWAPLARRAELDGDLMHSSDSKECPDKLFALKERMPEPRNRQTVSV